MAFNNNPFVSKQNKCNIANCLECLSINECKLCKPDFISAENKCYLKECSLFGSQCKYCTEFDCISCIQGYKVSYGFCEKEEYLLFLEKFLGFILPTFLLIVLFIFVVIYKKNKKNGLKKKIVKAEIIYKKRPSTGQYIIYNNNEDNINEENKENEDNINNNNNNENEQFINFDLSSEFSSSSNNCAICGKKNIFSFSICGCALCKEHSVQNLICPIHNIQLNRKFYIKKSFDSVEIIENDKNKYIKLCSVCNAEPATTNFNCGCPVTVCNKCFNDNIFLFKIKKCPGCNKDYCEKDN